MESHDSAPVLAVVGPTASGKSAVALQLAERLRGEIVSCDSVQVYRRFEIGTAKPSPAERSRVPHHLLDVVNWDESFDAQRYRTLAVAAIAAIRSRGHVPIFCGGTGLYLRALRYGLAPTPQVDEQLRAELTAAEQAQPGSLYQRLASLDPETHARIDPKNWVHVLRAVEISLQAGEPASALRARHGFRAEEQPMIMMALQRPDKVLKKRIAQRGARMLQTGLLTEVRGLLETGVSADCRPMRAVGYKEAADVVLGREKANGLHQRIVHSTWQYARRQRTWLRRENDVTVLECDSEDEASHLIVRHLQQYEHMKSA